MLSLYPPKRLCEVEMINLAAKNKDAFIAWCEDSYSKRIEHVCATILTGRFKVVMLTGPSSCGKTTTSGRIASKLVDMGKNAKVISLDNFFRCQDEYPVLPDGTKDFESIGTIDIPELTRCISQLMQKGEADIPIYDFVTAKRSEKRDHIEVGDGIVIVEGIHALNPQITTNFGKSDLFKVYLSMREEYSLNGHRLIPTIDMRLARRAIRDNLFRGYPPKRTLSLWSNVCRGETQYIKVFKPEADYLLDTSHSYEPCLMSPMLNSINTEEIDNIDHMNLFNALKERYSLFSSIFKEDIPNNSLLREFVGN